MKKEPFEQLGCAAKYSGLNAFAENLISRRATDSRNQSFVRPFRCLDCFTKGQSKIQNECE